MTMEKGKLIVLINPLYRKEWEYIEDNPAAVLPLGILSIGTVLVGKGYRIKIIDACVNPNYMQEIREAIENNPLFIGISAMTAQLYSALRIARFIRQKNGNRKMPIVWGGIHPTIFPESTATDSSVDIVVIGAGEYACLDLAGALSIDKNPELNKIRGIAFYDNGRFIHTNPREHTDINNLPFINYDFTSVNDQLKYNAIVYAVRKNLPNLLELFLKQFDLTEISRLFCSSDKDPNEYINILKGNILKLIVNADGTTKPGYEQTMTVLTTFGIHA